MDGQFPPSVAAFSERVFVWPTEGWSHINLPTPTDPCVRPETVPGYTEMKLLQIYI